jgi:hypothetical protein
MLSDRLSRVSVKLLRSPAPPVTPVILPGMKTEVKLYLIGPDVVCELKNSKLTKLSSQITVSETIIESKTGVGLR